MTKREIEMAFGDLSKYAEDPNLKATADSPLDAMFAGKFAQINVREKAKLPVLKT